MIEHIQQIRKDTENVNNPNIKSNKPNIKFYVNADLYKTLHSKTTELFFKFIYLFIYGCVGSSFLCEGFLLVVASGGHSSSPCAGLSLSRPLLLRSTGSRRAGSVIVVHGPSCSTACGIFPDQGSNPCPLHWQADSQPLRHQGSPTTELFKSTQRTSLKTDHILSINQVS